MLGRHCTGQQLEKVVAGYRGVLAATVEGARGARARRHLYWEYDNDGSLLIQARIPAEEGALILAALEHAERAEQAERNLDAEAEADSGECSAEHSRDSLSMRRADALVALARAELALDGQHHTGADPVELTVHVDAESLVCDQVGDRCEISAGPSIAPETARRLGCDAGLVRIIERDGKPLTVGRRTRSVPPALRRALSDRDPCCRFPGCTHVRYLHAHHIHHWARGGSTNLSNLINLCPQHHRLVHEGGFNVRNTVDDGVIFERPDGRAIPDRPPAIKPRGPALPEQNRRRGLLITLDSCRPLSAGDTLDYGMAVEGLAQEDGLYRRGQAPPRPADCEPPAERAPIVDLWDPAGPFVYAREGRLVLGASAEHAGGPTARGRLRATKLPRGVASSSSEATAGRSPANSSSRVGPGLARFERTNHRPRERTG